MTSCRVEEDTTYPGGYALIHVSAPMAEGDRDLAFERPGSDKPYLGPNGWQTQAVTLQADAVLAGPTQTTLKIGPDIVDQIDEDWRILIRLPGIDFESTLFWPAITRSGRTQRTTALAPGEQTTLSQKHTPLKRAPAAAPDPAPEPAPEPIPVTSVHAGAASPPRPGHARVLAGALLALVLLLCAGGAFWWFQTRPAGEASGSPANIVAAPPDSAPAANVETAERTAPARPAQVSPAERKAELQRLAQSGSPGDLYAFGRQSLQAGDRETGYLAVDIAQQRGHGEAMMQVGRWYDPRHHGADRMFSRPNSEQAARYYKRAYETGLSAGGDELRGLCSALSRDPPADPVEQDAAATLLSTSCN